MRSRHDLGETYSAYVEAVAAGDAAAAADVMIAALDDAVPTEKLLLDVIAPSQRLVGERWFAGEWSVADEHAATAIAEQVLAAVAPPQRFAEPGLRAVFGCVEGEWHSLPVKLAAELARAAGIDVRVLGGSTPAIDLGRHLRATEPDVVALSATLPANLLGAARCIEAAHVAGVPVVVGGQAWGGDGRRAAALGADGWSSGDGAVAEVLRATAAAGQCAEAVALPPEVWSLETVAQEVLEIALDRHAAASPWVAGMTAWQKKRTLEDLRWLARHAAAAVAVDDVTVVTDLLCWLDGLLGPRGVPRVVLTDGCLFLADSVEAVAPRGAAMLRVATEDVSVAQWAMTR